MIGYAVVCDHPDEGATDTARVVRRYLIADIDDGRPDGGVVHLAWLYRGGVGTRVAAVNKRGSRRSIPLECGHPRCPLNVRLEETSLAEVIDLVAPHRNMLPLDEEGRHIVSFAAVCHIVSQLRTRGRRQP